MPSRPILAFVLLAGGALWLQGAKEDPKAVERGRKSFESACGFCHGNDATGSRGPDLIRSALLAHDEAGNRLGPVIRSGRPDKGMPSFPFSNAQISDIAAFLHSQAAAALASSHIPHDYPVKKLLTGNAAAGKAYFFGAGHCDECHSPTGDLAGVAKRYVPLVLEARFLYPGPAKRTATVTLPSGDKISGTLAHLDEFHVSLRDSEGWYRSWDVSDVKVDVQDPLAKHRDLLHEYTDADIHNLFAYLETLK